jgi:hypothetical protein
MPNRIDEKLLIEEYEFKKRKAKSLNPDVVEFVMKVPKYVS